MALLGQIVGELKKAGVPAADAAAVRQAMEKAGASFGLVPQGVDDMLAAMVKAGINALGSLPTQTGTLRLSTIKVLTKVVVAEATKQAAGAPTLADSVKKVVGAVTSSLKTAKIPPEALTETLAAATQAAVDAVLKQAGAANPESSALVFAVSTGATNGVKGSGYTVATLAVAVAGISNGAMHGAVAAGISITALPELSKSLAKTIIDSLEGSGVDSTTATSYVFAGIRVGATEGGASANVIAAIVVKTQEVAPSIPPAEYPKTTEETEKEDNPGASEQEDMKPMTLYFWGPSVYTKRDAIKVKAEQQEEDQWWGGFQSEDSMTNKPEDFDPETLVIHDGAPAPDDVVIVRTGHKYTQVRYALAPQGEKDRTWGPWVDVGAVASVPTIGLADGEYYLYAQARVGTAESEEQSTDLVLRRAFASAELVTRESRIESTDSLSGHLEVEVLSDGIAAYKFWVSETPGATCNDAVFRNYWLKGNPNIRESNPPLAIGDLNYYGSWDGADTQDKPFLAKTFRVCVKLRDRAGNEQTQAMSLSTTTKLRLGVQPVPDLKQVVLKNAPTLEGNYSFGSVRVVARGGNFFLAGMTDSGIKVLKSVDHGATWSQIYSTTISSNGRLLAAAASSSAIAFAYLDNREVNVLSTLDETNFTLAQIDSRAATDSDLSLAMQGTRAFVGFGRQPADDDPVHPTVTTRDLASGASPWSRATLATGTHGYGVKVRVANNANDVFATSASQNDDFKVYKANSADGATWTTASVGETWAAGSDSIYLDGGRDHFLSVTSDRVVLTTNSGTLSRAISGTEWTADRESWQHPESDPNEPPAPAQFHEPAGSFLQDGGLRLLSYATLSGNDVPSLNLNKKVGENWVSTAIVHDVQSETMAFASSLNDMVVVYKSYKSPWRVARSTDGGANWNTTSTTVTLPGVTAGDAPQRFPIVFKHDTYHFIGTDEGALNRSSDESHWESLGRISGANSFSASGDDVYAAGPGFFFRSTDNGRNWSSRKFFDVSEPDSYLTAIKAFEQTVVVAFAKSTWVDHHYESEAKLYVSTNSGDTFGSAINITGSDGSLKAAEMTFSDTDLTIAWAQSNGQVVLRRYSTSGTSSEVASVPTEINANDLYGVAAVGTKISIMSDRGAAFAEHNGSNWSGVIELTSVASSCGKISVANGQPAYLTDAPDGLRFVTRNGSGTWITTMIDSVDAGGCGSIGRDGSTIYVAYPSHFSPQQMKLVKSTDGGSTWIDLSP